MFKKHKCDYKVLGNVNESANDREYTHILFQCECGEWMIDTIPGEWDTETINKIK